MVPVEKRSAGGGQRGGGFVYLYQYVVRANVEGSENELKAEIEEPSHWKVDLTERRVVDFQWEGGYLAQLLNADSELKNLLLRGGLDKLEVKPDKKYQCVRIVHMPGIWTVNRVGPVLTMGRKAFPTLEDFEAYDRIAQQIRSIVEKHFRSYVDHLLK